MKRLVSKDLCQFPCPNRLKAATLLTALFITLFSLPGCTKRTITHPADPPVSPGPPVSPATSSPPPETPKQAPPATAATTPASSDITDALLVFYTKWRRTPYRLGGLSHKGIDCSGFTYLFFKENYNITLPRTVSEQAAYGRKISRKNLKPGDLVFFKTGFFQRHVGICMDNQRFAHTSSSTGVMVSRFDNIYWEKRYWKARRLLN